VTKQLELADLLPDEAPEARDEVVRLDTLPVDFPGPRPTRDMINTVKAYGVIEPIVIIEYKGKRTVTDGRRRVMAANAAGQGSIPARVFFLNGASGSLITLILNENRSANPVAELNAILDLTHQGASEKVIQQATGIPIARIRKRLKLAGLNADLLDALKAGRISVNVAYACVGLPGETQEFLAGVLAEFGKLTAEDVRMARRARSESAAAALPDELFEAPPETLRDWKTATLESLNHALVEIPEDSAQSRRVRRAIGKAIEALE
jgi:ParB-like chromosome segregation protein Spo0J